MQNRLNGSLKHTYTTLLKKENELLQLIYCSSLESLNCECVHPPTEMYRLDNVYCATPLTVVESPSAATTLMSAGLSL